MRYLALGDSISVDDYTGVPGGGAASQLAKLLEVSAFQNLTHDGYTTDRVLDSLQRVESTPDLITLTVGGNDFLGLLSFSARRSPSDWEALSTTVLSRVENVLLRALDFG